MSRHLLPSGPEGREERRPFWDAVQAKAKAIDAESKTKRWNRGSSGGPGSVMLGVRGMEYPFKIFTMDGRVKLHVITVWEDPISGRMKQSVDVWWSDNDEINLERLQTLREHPDSVLIVNHTFYQLGSESGGVQGGFGGRTVKFRRLGPFGSQMGPVMATRNLWFSGPIAPAWHDRLPDNAVFLDGFDGPGVNY